MYPIDKYRFVVNGNKVIALSTYAGRTVRGTAICSAEDTFDIEKGKQLAAARCAVKIAQKREARAARKFQEADAILFEAEDYYNAMGEYRVNAAVESMKAEKNLTSLLQSL